MCGTRGLVAVSFVICVTMLALSGGCGGGGGGSSVTTSSTPLWQATTGNCISCHDGVETAHLGFPLGCTQCHGGDPEALTKEEAHVLPQQPLPQDATILPVDYPDTAYLRFVNPTNLRVVSTTCGASGAGTGASCHAGYVDDVMKSMMATTAGHLAGGGYQNGILPDRTAVWANVPVADNDGHIPVAQGGLAALIQMPAELTSFPPDSFERHYSDVPRKICMRCHLWSRGNAVRGVPGHEGNYRSEGCAACHMPYTNSGLSESGDPTIPAGEPGHPRIHQITRKIPTDQCGHCHTRGARIGLSYRGLAQLPPNTPAAPNYAGLTPNKIHGAYHVQDPTVNPPDIHHERGMHCIDCHVREGLMGDGNIYGHMDQATEIECEDCHGTPTAFGTMVTSKGTPLTHLRWEDDEMILKSKVTSQDHVVPQVKNIVDPTHAFFNPVASTAMTADHLKPQGGLECYACHSSWQNNCYGCHFERDLGDTSLDFVAGYETPGKPRTSVKYFLNFKNFHMGWNSEGKVAPYVTGCQVLATVTDPLGNKILDQKLPVTALGRSGLSLNPVQPHTTRATPRFCTECHSNPAALGLGTESFYLSRRWLFALSPAPQGALRVIDRKVPAASSLNSSLSLPDPRGQVVVTDQVHGSASVAYVADGSLGLVAVDLSDPMSPQVSATVALTDARSAAVAGTTLFVAAGTEGVLAFDVSNPLQPSLVGSVATTEARKLAVHGLHVLVADGAAGLTVVDVTDRTSPVIAATLDLNGPDPAPNDARDVAVMPHYRNPPPSGLKLMDVVAYVADGSSGVRIVHLNTVTFPSILATLVTSDAHAVFAKSHYVPGNANTASIEKEFLFVADGGGGLMVVDVTTPWLPQPIQTVSTFSPATDVFVANALEPPVNRLYAYVAAGSGCFIYDASTPSAVSTVAVVPVPVSGGLDLERIDLDRLVDEDGLQIKDVSHDGARTFDRAEIERILGVGN